MRRSRGLLAAMQVTQVACGGKEGVHTELVERLKAHEVIGSRSSQVKLAALSGLFSTLRHLRQPEKASKQISDIMYGLIPAAVLIDRPGQRAAASVASPNSVTAAAGSSMDAAVAAANAAHAAVQMLGGAFQQNFATATATPAVATNQTAGGVPTGLPAPPLMGNQQQQQQVPAALNALSSFTPAATSLTPPQFTPTPTGVDLTMVATAVIAATAAATAATRQASSSRAAANAEEDPFTSSASLPQRLPKKCYNPKHLRDQYSLNTIMKDW